MSAHVNSIGLDVGTSRIVRAQQNSGEFEFESQLNAFVTIPYSKITANVLEKEGVPHSVQGGEFLAGATAPAKWLHERFRDLLPATPCAPSSGRRGSIVGDCRVHLTAAA